MTSMTTVAFILALVLGLLFWLDSARARELAAALSSELCNRRGYQLLDDSVSLARMALRTTTRGLRLRRMYRFEFSIDGVERRLGYVIFVGDEFECIDFGDEPTEKVINPAEDDKVLPFRRRDH